MSKHPSAPFRVLLLLACCFHTHASLPRTHQSYVFASCLFLSVFSACLQSLLGARDCLLACSRVGLAVPFTLFFLHSSVRSFVAFNSLLACPFIQYAFIWICNCLVVYHRET